MAIVFAVPLLTSRIKTDIVSLFNPVVLRLKGNEGLAEGTEELYSILTVTFVDFMSTFQLDEGLVSV